VWGQFELGCGVSLGQGVGSIWVRRVRIRAGRVGENVVQRGKEGTQLVKSQS